MKAHKVREEKERNLQSVIKTRGTLVAWAWRAKAAIANLTPEERRQRQQVKSRQHIEREKVPSHLRKRRASVSSAAASRSKGTIVKVPSLRRVQSLSVGEMTKVNVDDVGTLPKLEKQQKKRASLSDEKMR